MIQTGVDAERSPSQNEKARERLDRMAWYLDSAFRVPGTDLRFGWDGVLGLVPGVGDLLSALVSGAIVVEASRLGAPKILVARMSANVALDLLVGSVPVVGDAFDFFWKVNQRNLTLLNRHLDNH